MNDKSRRTSTDITYASNPTKSHYSRGGTKEPLGYSVIIKPCSVLPCYHFSFLDATSYHFPVQNKSQGLFNVVAWTSDGSQDKM
jgi:hypothetical protein